jgi:hypothetical protein
VLPQVGLYKTQPGLRFSFVALDKSNGPALVTGEYKQGAAGGRIVRWPLGPGNLPTGQAAAAFTSPAGSMQGALMLNGRIGASSSAGEGNPGVFTTGAPGAATTKHTWAAGVEDVSYAPTSGRIYSLTEYPKARVVFGVPASTLGF